MLFRRNNMMEDVRRCQKEGGILIDVRDGYEYASGHIPGSINIPASKPKKILDYVQDKDTPIYLYCLTGARSSRMLRALKKMGFQNVRNLGGIKKYQGPMDH